METLTFWRNFIKMQLKNNLEFITKQSIKNFHFKGLNYICFQFLPNLTIRLYIIKPQDNLKTESVNIHNHLYDSQVLMLVGEMANNIYAETIGADYHKYYLTSALNPKNTTGNVLLEKLGKTDLVKVDSINLSAGQTHLQEHKEIHNVENKPNEYLAFMVFEHPTVKDNSILYSPIDYGSQIPTKENVYDKYSEVEIDFLLLELIEKMKKEIEDLGGDAVIRQPQQAYDDSMR